MPMSTKWPLHEGLRLEISGISHLSYACYMYRPSHIPWLDHTNTIIGIFIVKFENVGAGGEDSFPSDEKAFMV